jgi:hypothetical protein
MSRTNEWIIGRGPTQDDADLHGDIQVRVSPYSYFDAAATCHWSQVDASQTWRHTRYWNLQQADRIAALEQRVADLETVVDYLIKCPNKRHSLGAL